MNRARHEAESLLRQYRLSRPSLDEIVAIVSNLGYELVDFDPKGEEVRELIETLGLDEAVLRQSAFLYTNGSVRLLFLQDSMDEEEKRFAAAHELGHIVCGHADTDPSVQDEYEANEFVHFFLNPSLLFRCRMKLLAHGKAAAAILAALILLAAASVILLKRSAENGMTDYYVTAAGHKYHLRDCSLIRDKGSVLRLSEKAFESGAYEPCQVCLGGGESP